MNKNTSPAKDNVEIKINMSKAFDRAQWDTIVKSSSR